MPETNPPAVAPATTATSLAQAQSVTNLPQAATTTTTTAVVAQKPTSILTVKHQTLLHRGTVTVATSPETFPRTETVIMAMATVSRDTINHTMPQLAVTALVPGTRTPTQVAKTARSTALTAS